MLMSLAVADVNRWISSKRFSPYSDEEKERGDKIKYEYVWRIQKSKERWDETLRCI